jgi:hypothetical protein
LRFSEVSHQSTIRIDSVSIEAEDAADASSVVYFLFADFALPPRDSFVLPLTRTNDIEHVRTWLRTGSAPGGQSASIVRIAPGSDGINRDYLAPGAPQWSWHIVQMVGFSQFLPGITVPPGYIEMYLNEWMSSSRGINGFFHKPILELLPRSSPVISASSGSSSFELTWTDLGVHYVYTLEVASSLNSSNWTAAPGGTWPTTSTNWTNSATLNQSRFYRVKAELKNP